MYPLPLVKPLPPTECHNPWPATATREPGKCDCAEDAEKRAEGAEESEGEGGDAEAGWQWLGVAVGGSGW
jgi:hypothetical protein